MNKVPKFHLYDERFSSEELSNEFHAFFYRNNLISLFNNEELAGSISVTYVDAKSVLNNGGSYQKTLNEFAELLTIGNDNQSYEVAVFAIIKESRSFQAMMNRIKDLTHYIKTIDSRYKHNTWNIVWYNKDLE